VLIDQTEIDWQAVHVLAKQAALRAVKRQIQKEGRFKVALIPAGKLGALATQYLKTHPNSFRKPWPRQRKFLNETRVQNEAAE
jgi:hypothetical protein